MGPNPEVVGLLAAKIPVPNPPVVLVVAGCPNTVDVPDPPAGVLFCPKVPPPPKVLPPPNAPKPVAGLEAPKADVP